MKPTDTKKMTQRLHRAGTKNRRFRIRSASIPSSDWVFAGGDPGHVEVDEVSSCGHRICPHENPCG